MAIPPLTAIPAALGPASASSPPGSFGKALATSVARQDVPAPGTIYRALEAERPLAIVDAAAHGFALGGPIGAAIGGGLAALGPFLHLPLPTGDGVTGDQSVVQRTQSMLTAYGPLAQRPSPTLGLARPADA